MQDIPKLTRGVLTFAFGEDYQRMAYAQALSLRSLGTDITVVVDKEVTFEKLNTVANIVVLTKPMQKFEWENYAYDISPYDSTIKTDADVVWPIDSFMESYFNTVERLGVVSGKTCNLRREEVDSKRYRLKELRNGWPSFYTACMGFNKGEKASKFFTRVKEVYNNWWSLKTKIGDLPATTDSVFSLAYFMEFTQNVIPVGLQFVHAKADVCGNTFTEHWTHHMPYSIDEGGRVYVNHHRVSIPLHYFDKGYLVERILTRLEEVYKENEKKGQGFVPSRIFF